MSPSRASAMNMRAQGQELKTAAIDEGNWPCSLNKTSLAMPFVFHPDQLGRPIGKVLIDNERDCEPALRRCSLNNQSDIDVAVGKSPEDSPASARSVRHLEERDLRNLLVAADPTTDGCSLRHSLTNPVPAL